jgi:hypothetical protein
MQEKCWKCQGEQKKEEKDEKSLSLGMPMHPKEKKIEDQEEQVEEEWSSYPSSSPNNVTHKFL